MMPRDLHGLFSPQSVAVIGASSSAQKVGAIVLKNILDSGFQGAVYPVNPQESQLAGLQCYPDLDSLPTVPDLAVFAIPAAAVIQVLEQVGLRGIKNAVIFSAGFKEIGQPGESLQNQLIATAQKYQINLLGPNCLGFANNRLPINVTFGQVVKDSGNLRIISQSGAIAASLFDWCQTTKLGFGEFVTIGNKAVISENDILGYWAALPSGYVSQPGLSTVSPIGLYLESITDGAEFVKIATQISRTTPIFALKPGKSKAAASAMHSHTGAIAGEDSILDTAFRQSGVIRCQEMGEFFDLARAFAWENAPQGPRVAVVSNAGGPAVLSTDTINRLGLQMAQFSPQTQQKFSSFMPRMASFLNPVDVMGDALADRFGQALEDVLQEPTVDAAVVILTPQLMTQIEKTAEIIGRLSAKYSQPILCSFIGGGLVAAGEKILNDYKIPSFAFPEMAIKTLSLMWQWQSWRNDQNKLSPPSALPPSPSLEAAQSILSTAKTHHDSSLDNLLANQLMVTAGISTPPTQLVSSLEQAELFVSSAGWPVVLKISSPGLLHKIDVGGVITHLLGLDDLKSAWLTLTKTITTLNPEISQNAQIQIQKEVPDGLEVIVGVKKDPSFGPVLLFGAGGKYAELLADRNLHLLPMSDLETQQIVTRSKVFNLLKGFRGDSAYNLDPLYETISRLSHLAQTLEDISEIEINPLIITHEGVWAVDTKVLLR